MAASADRLRAGGATSYDVLEEFFMVSEPRSAPPQALLYLPELVERLPEVDRRLFFAFLTCAA